ncbi:hypothetical protein Q6A26_21610 [Xanthomonas euvesicatoria pv. eucalypti]|uniref:Y-family DNA polymerase n=1 Tax=Xanthomonas euvesicatoria TaxID=456327 RepID=UPI0026E11C29|nr:hypothetical protein [Xanthomonas euvesicatoria pv. eucalypti]MDO7938752.1 hypothetical protein [Xanthomonas euvesicatoria pv. eucalypti]MDO7942988.1 hypothetical protein [Xanthomonas euvesicatoria pv. eucalypti]MDO7947165.1 hypothetical protein [Xanthomonas euvesicatoria pv. eucalypti]MDO7951146.1 hypothetical protein [Xanthomonas euvesicatoria pv. eucalypti]
MLRDLFPRVEVYSIDESFVSFDGISEREHERVAIEARARILKWTGIPCCVGIGPNEDVREAGQQGGQEDRAWGHDCPARLSFFWSALRWKKCGAWAIAPGPSSTSKGF